ncbi:hypothetical protein PspLS_02167 [Pyricularia sp. CBS 133598]|nr:hypothetical protein PspLS_02167 [Pyricularia sp. CBS 133598]
MDLGEHSMSIGSPASYTTAHEQMGDVDLDTATSTINRGETSFKQEPISPSMSENQVITMPSNRMRNHPGSSQLQVNSHIAERPETTHSRQHCPKSCSCFERMKMQLLREGIRARSLDQTIQVMKRKKNDIQLELERSTVIKNRQSNLIADNDKTIGNLLKDSCQLKKEASDASRQYEDQIAQQDATIIDRERTIGELQAHIAAQEVELNKKQKKIEDLELKMQNLNRRHRGELASKDMAMAQLQLDITKLEKQECELSAKLRSSWDESSSHCCTIKEQKTTIAELSEKLANTEINDKLGWCRVQRLEEIVAEREAKIAESQGIIAEQKQFLDKQKQFIDERRAADFEAVVADVSCELPDSEIRSKFCELLGTEVDDWCMEYKAQKLTLTEALQDLLCCGQAQVVWQQDTPDNLRLKVDSPKAPVILLQAALSNFLCRHFLTDPFFLLKMNYGEAAVEGKLTQLKTEYSVLSTFLKECESETTALQWRATTAGLIEYRFNLCEGMAKELAALFMDDYQALLKQHSSDMLDELSVIILNFARFCLRLWKRKMPIYTYNNHKIGGQQFKVNSRYWDVTPLVGLERGDNSLDGRPMCVVIKPVIFTKSATSGHKTIWSKASVWVSNESADTPPPPP